MMGKGRAQATLADLNRRTLPGVDMSVSMDMQPFSPDFRFRTVSNCGEQTAHDSGSRKYEKNHVGGIGNPAKNDRFWRNNS